MCPFCGGWFDGMGGLAFFLSLVLLLVFLIGIGLLIWWIARQAGAAKQVPPPTQKSRALELLDERYAKGEISKEDFEERREILTR